MGLGGAPGRPVASATAAPGPAGGGRACRAVPVGAPLHRQRETAAGQTGDEATDVGPPGHPGVAEAHELAEALADIAIQSPSIPVVHNVHAKTEAEPESIRALLVEQIHSPVQWTACVQAMVGSGVGRLVECGPGKVLSGLNRRIDKSLASFSLEEPEGLHQTLSELA